MLRLALGSVALLTVLLVAPIAVIRARPFDDSALSVLLTPADDCPAPCFMGIQPGVTTAGEALRILEQHEWAQVVDIMQTPVRWTWSGRQPGWIDEHVPGQLVTERFITEVRDDAVTRIAFQSRLTLADVYLLLGPPDQAWFRTSRSAPLMPVHAAYYKTYGLQLSNDLRCPLRLDSVWRTPAELSFAIVPTRIGTSDDSEPVFPASGASWPRRSPVC